MSESRDGGWRIRAQRRAQRAAAALKAEYRAGREGDDTPPPPIWATPSEQLDRLLGLIGVARRAPARAGEDGTHVTVAQEAEQAAADDADAEQVATALRGVDWAGVRAATSEKAGEARAAMRSMAEQVDWAKVQPMAAQVSSALIAAVASGRIGIGGPLGSTVARTLAGQTGLADKVAKRLISDDKAELPPDFRGAIEVSSREADPPA